MRLETKIGGRAPRKNMKNGNCQRNALNRAKLSLLQMKAKRRTSLMEILQIGVSIKSMHMTE